MTQLLQKAFQEAQKLSEHLQDEIAQQLLVRSLVGWVEVTKPNEFPIIGLL